MGYRSVYRDRCRNGSEPASDLSVVVLGPEKCREQSEREFRQSNRSEHKYRRALVCLSKPGVPIRSREQYVRHKSERNDTEQQTQSQKEQADCNLAHQGGSG